VEAHPVENPTTFMVSVTSTHPNAVRIPGGRNWTYRGDIVEIWTRNPTLRKPLSYELCHTVRVGVRCFKRVLPNNGGTTWRLRIGSDWAGWVDGKYRGFINFTWRVHGQTVAQRRVWVSE
jgi:hypothetical protein